MKFIIKSDDNNLEMILQTTKYRNLWRQNSRKILKSFRSITGLDFQQSTITARVFSGNQSRSGSYHYPMKLRGMYFRDEDKLVLLVHELSHRLLGGNGLWLINMGLANKEISASDLGEEMDHRHIYLFEYDVIKMALGDTMAKECILFEEKESENGSNGPHAKAWRWAMGMTYEQRQKAMKILASKAKPRNQQDDLRKEKEVKINPDGWYNDLLLGKIR